MNGSATISATKMRHDQRDEDRDDLGHEHERHFLNLRERLHERNRDADHERDHHQGAGDPQQRPDAVACDVEYLCAIHQIGIRMISS